MGYEFHLGELAERGFKHKRVHDALDGQPGPRALDIVLHWMSLADIEEMLKVLEKPDG